MIDPHRIETVQNAYYSRGRCASVLMPLLWSCVERLTHYRNYEPLIVDNDSADQATIEYQDPYSRNTTGCSRPTISSRDKAL